MITVTTDYGMCVHQNWYWSGSPPQKSMWEQRQMFSNFLYACSWDQ